MTFRSAGFGTRHDNKTNNNTTTHNNDNNNDCDNNNNNNNNDTTNNYMINDIVNNRMTRSPGSNEGAGVAQIFARHRLFESHPALRERDR